MYETLANPTNLLLAILGAFFVGMSKGGLPGTGALTVWIYAQIFGAKHSVAIVLPLLVCADVYAVIVYRKHTDWTLFKRLAPALVVGALFGALLFLWISDQYFKRVIGALILLVVVLRFLPKPKRSKRCNDGKEEHALTGPVFSLFSGMFSMLSNAGSPLMAYYLIGKQLPKLNFLGTYVVLIMVSNLTSLPLHIAIHSVELSELSYSFALGLLTIVGVLLARWIVSLIPQKKYEYFILIIVALAGIELMI